MDKKYGILIITVYFQVVLLEIQVIGNFMVSQIKALVFNDGKEFPTDTGFVLACVNLIDSQIQIAALIKLNNGSYVLPLQFYTDAVPVYHLRHHQ